MSKETEKSQPNNRTYSPKQVMIIYSSDQTNEIHRQTPTGEGDSYYVEIADVMSDKGKSYIGAGRPLTYLTLQNLISIIADKDKKTLSTIQNMAPENLLLLDQRPGRQLLVWWTPAQQQIMYHEGRKMIKTHVPALVYIASMGRLSVAALKMSKRPSLSTKLFHAPFFNVYEDARVCLGTVKPPAGIVDLQLLVNAWQKCFWNSEFSNTVTGGYKKALLTKWWRKKRTGKFNPKWLKPSNKTLKQLCEAGE